MELETFNILLDNLTFDNVAKPKLVKTILFTAVYGRQRTIVRTPNFHILEQ